MTRPRDRESGRPTLLGALALCLGAYLYGSLPLVYGFARRRRVDLQRVGSGNVGATNLLGATGPAVATVGWIFDASKGFIPVIAARRMGWSDDVAGVAGACGVVGQCWPISLRFQGGRGVSSYVGATAALSPSVWPLTLLPMIGGGLWRMWPRVWHISGKWDGRERAARSKSVPLGCFVSAAAYPLVYARGTSADHPARVAPTALAGVVLLRRLTAPQPDDDGAGPARNRSALLYRLLYDRNTSA